MVGIDRMIDIVETLRGEGGCPWDRAQTPNSLKPMLVEEVYEVLEAIESGDDGALKSELGDLLFTAALLAQMKAEQDAFDLHDAAESVSEKMVRRHPHVFGDGEYDGIRGWEAIKAAERAREASGPVSALDGVPRALPALLRAQRVSKKAASTGFDWDDARGPRTKLNEELAELDEAIDGAQVDAITDELGDVLFTVVNLARHLGVSAEDALQRATLKFERRFRAVEADVRGSGADPRDLDAQALDDVWNRVKRTV